MQKGRADPCGTNKPHWPPYCTQLCHSKLERSNTEVTGNIVNQALGGCFAESSSIRRVVSGRWCTRSGFQFHLMADCELRPTSATAFCLSLADPVPAFANWNRD
jgi:hypothetical protein